MKNQYVSVEMHNNLLRTIKQYTQNYLQFKKSIAMIILLDLCLFASLIVAIASPVFWLFLVVLLFIAGVYILKIYFMIKLVGSALYE